MRFRLSLIAALGAAFCLSCSRQKPGAQPSPVTQKGWESSGGSGVACFASEAQARQAAARASAGQQLAELKKDITSLVTLDYWDYQAKFHFANTSPPLALSEVDALLERYAPIFQTRFRLVRARLDYGSWQKVESLPQIDDRHPKQPLPKNCALVQLAVRYTRSTAARFPEVRVEIDESLAKLLDAPNQALLTLHEQLYLFGKETPSAHKNSDDIRWLTAYLLSRDLLEKLATLDEPYRARFVQDMLVRYFGDYYLFFIDDPITRPAYSPLPRTPYSRYLSFGTVLRKLRDRKQKCLDEKRSAAECEAVTHADYALLNTFNEEESFVYLTRWVFSSWVYNPENVLRFDPTDPSKVDEPGRADLQWACEAIKDYQPQFIRAIYIRAHAYCARLGVSTPSLQKLHCRLDDKQVLLDREADGTYHLSLRATNVSVEEGSLSCFRARVPYLNVSCEKADFHFIGMDTSRIDPDSDERQDFREFGWGDMSQRWYFTRLAQCEIK